MLVNTKDITTEGTLGGERVDMTIDEHSLVHIMTLLSDLYSNPAAAVCREYGVNALDSHLAAGQTRPVEITTPGRYNPYLLIQDFGVGLGADDIRNIYSKFGASTKRDSNVQAGMLGLGCKSALTYTDQFTIISVKDGTKLSAVIGRNTDGTGVIEIVDQSATDEPNGVTIKVPCSDTAKMMQEAINFARFVTPGAVLVNGEQINPNVEMINDKYGIDLKDSKNYYHNVPDRVVMGNVSYPIDRVQMSAMYQHGAVVIYAPMGAVDFTPSREELFYSERTKGFINAARSTFGVALSTYLSAKMLDCKNDVEAYKVAQALREVHGATVNLTYNGAPVPKQIGRFDRARINSEGRIKRTNDISVASVYDNEVIITGWTNDKITKAQHAKVEKAFAANGSDSTLFYLTEKCDYLGLFNPAHVYDWADIVKFKAPKVSAAVKATRTYDTLSGYGRGGWCAVDNTKTIVYGQWSYMRGRSKQLYELAGDDAVIYIVPESQQKNFIKAYPTAISYSDFCKQKVDQYNATVTDAELALSNYSTYARSDMLYVDKILDPALKARCASSLDPVMQQSIAKARERYSQMQYAAQIGRGAVKPHPKGSDNQETGYVLLDKASYYGYGSEKNMMKAAMTEYVNMMYTKNLLTKGNNKNEV
jgi:hypothetical protein